MDFEEIKELNCITGSIMALATANYLDLNDAKVMEYIHHHPVLNLLCADLPIERLFGHRSRTKRMNAAFLTRNGKFLQNFADTFHQGPKVSAK